MGHRDVERSLEEIDRLNRRDWEGPVDLTRAAAAVVFVEAHDEGAGIAGFCGGGIGTLQGVRIAARLGGARTTQLPQRSSMASVLS